MCIINNIYKFKVSKKKSRKKKSKKRHVETMFIQSKQKKYSYYFKPHSFDSLQISPVKAQLQERKVFYIKTLTSCYLTLFPLKSILKFFKWFIKFHKVENFFKYRLYVFPDFVLTSKPKDVRMGKGKGAPKSKVCLIKKGQIIFSLNIIDFPSNWFLVSKLLKQFKYKLPKNFIISTNFW